VGEGEIAMALGKYGAGFRIQEYELETEGTYSGSPKRKVIVYKSYTVDPETGEKIREFDSPTWVNYEFTTSYEAGKKAGELYSQGKLFTVVEVSDGRSGDNSEMSLSPLALPAFLQGFLEWEKK
jgi:hypothetical protein